MSRDTRKSIKDFVHHVESLEAEEDPEGNGFHKEYRLIHEVQVKNRRDNAFPMTAGKADNNLKKNRYKDILPYDEHRILLSIKDGDENSDYINASRLMGVKGTGGYIASQGPLASTVDDFWRMIWECNVEIVFMACKIVELGKIKCKQYWNDVGKSDAFGDITVFTESEEEISYDFMCRKFLVKRDEEERHVTQFHYLGWPDHGIPDDPAHIRDLINITRQTRQNEQAPLLIHCSAGCGRTGAIVAIDFVWTLLDQGRFDETFSLYDLICNFREQRMSMVQTADQYALVNKVLKSLCEEWLDKMASHTYVNVELRDSATKGGGAYENAVIMDSSKASENNQTGPVVALSPETDDQPPPSYMAPQPPSSTSAQPSSYENVYLLPDRTPVMKATETLRGGDSNKTGEAKQQKQTVHRTVIQLGPTAAAQTPKTGSSSSGSKEIINFVRGDSTRSSTSSTSSRSASSSSAGRSHPISSATTNQADVQHREQQQSHNQATALQQDFAIYATVNKGNQKTDTNTPTSSVQNQKQQQQQWNDHTALLSPDSPVSASGNRSRSNSSNSPRHAAVFDSPSNNKSPGYKQQEILLDEDAYSLVKVDGGNGDHSKDVISSRNGHGSYEPISTIIDDGGAVAAAAAAAALQAYTFAGLSSSGGAAGNSSYASADQVTSATGQVPNGPPVTASGFGERLPRVKGPVPEPESWNSKQ